MTPSLSVLIPVYNALAQLELVLAGFCRQSFDRFEVIIGDDGSGPEMRAFVQSFAERSPFPLGYVYHPDQGYRRGAILNRAAQEAATRYLVVVDGDCIPHRRFVEAHWEHHAPGTVLVGRRVDLSERLTCQLTPPRVLEGKLERWGLGTLADAMLGRGSHWDEGVLLGSSSLRAWIGKRKEPSLLGSDFSLEKSLFEQINGFNEEFVSYGGEETELEVRLRLAGAELKWVRHQAIQYHLFHAQKPSNPQNEEIIARTRARGQAACPRGLKNLAS
jgi:glycosyltransferase involved in cell wall biosynthesis